MTQTFCDILSGGTGQGGVEPIGHVIEMPYDVAPAGYLPPGNYTPDDYPELSLYLLETGGTPGVIPPLPTGNFMKAIPDPAPKDLGYLEPRVKVGRESLESAPTDPVAPVPEPDFWMPLTSDINIEYGFGTEKTVDVSDAQDGSVMVGMGQREATFTRASTATYVGKDGLLKSAAIDEPRFEEEGILMEGGSTNYILNSRNIDSWDVGNGAAVTSDSEAFFGNTVSRVSVTADPASRVGKTTTTGSSDTATFSAWVKGTRGEEVRISLEVNSTTKRYKTITFTGEWERVEVTATASAVSTSMIPRFYSCGSAVTFKVACVQLENLPFASSYIPISWSPVNRAADLMTIPSENNVPILARYTTSFDIRATTNSTGVTPIYLNHNNGVSSLPKFDFTGNNSITYAPPRLPSGQAYISAGSGSNNSRITGVTGETGSSVYRDGQLVATAHEVPRNAPLGTIRFVGSSRATYHIRDFKIWHQALSAEQVRSLARPTPEPTPEPTFDLPLEDSLVTREGYGDPTLTRASTATYVDKSGVLRTAGIDEPRFEKEGILIEGESTNLLDNSGDYSSWVAGDGKPNLVSITQDSEIVLGKNVTKVEFLGDESGLYGKVERQYRLPTISLGDVYTASFMIKGTAGTTIQYGANISQGSDGGGYTTHTFSGGWEYVNYTATVTAAGAAGVTYPNIRRVSNSTATEVFIGYVQLEALPFASSYIPTSGSPVTRATDRLAIPLAGVGSEITVSMIVDSSGFTGNNRLFDFRSSPDYYWVLYNGSSLEVRLGNPDSRSAPVGLDYLSSPKTIAVSSGIGLFSNGIKVSGAPASTSNATFNSAFIGDDLGVGSRSIWGHIKNFRIWDKALTAEQVKEISGPTVATRRSI